MDSRELPRAISLFGADVYRIAYSQMGSRQAAEDVYQEVFVKLWRSDVVFENDDHLKFWLCRVAINQCRDAKRSWQRHPEVLVDSFDAEKAVDDFQLPDRGGERGILDIVDALPDAMKEAVHLHYVEGYSTKDVAKICGCSPATARTRLFRARKKIKEALEEGAR